MHQRFIFIFYLISFFTLPNFAQNWESIKTNKFYITGEGFGSTIEAADQQALQTLISKISVHVSSIFKLEEEEVVRHNSFESKSIASNNVNSYSQATLNNTGREILSPDPDAHVVRWIERSEIYKFYDGIENKVKEYTAAAYRAEQTGKIDLALRNYYWALSLLKSHQKPNEITYLGEKDGIKHVLMSWIPEQMNEIFGKIKASVIKREDFDVELIFTYDHYCPVKVD